MEKREARRRTQGGVADAWRGRDSDTLATHGSQTPEATALLLVMSIHESLCYISNPRCALSPLHTPGDKVHGPRKGGSPLIAMIANDLATTTWRLELWERLWHFGTLRTWKM